MQEQIVRDASNSVSQASNSNDLLLGNESQTSIESQIQKVLDILHLSDMKEQHPTVLSIGQKQRFGYCSILSVKQEG